MGLKSVSIFTAGVATGIVGTICYEKYLKENDMYLKFKSFVEGLFKEGNTDSEKNANIQEEV